MRRASAENQLRFVVAWCRQFNGQHDLLAIAWNLLEKHVRRDAIPDYEGRVHMWMAAHQSAIDALVHRTFEVLASGSCKAFIVNAVRSGACLVAGNVTGQQLVEALPANGGVGDRCFDYLRSECTHGAACKGRHIMDPSARPLCWPYLLHGPHDAAGGCSLSVCPFRHLTIADAEARQIRFGSERGALTASAVNQALANAPLPDLVQFFDAWGWQMDTWHISNIWNKLGNHLKESSSSRVCWVRENKVWLRELLQRTMELLPSFEARALANMLHGAAVMAQGEEAMVRGLFSSAEASVLKALEDFDVQNTSNVLYAYAMAGFTVLSSPIFAGMAACIKRAKLAWSEQGLSMVLWSYATAHRWRDMTAPPVFDALASAVMHSLDAFKPQGLSTIIWAYSTIEHAKPALFDTLAAECARLVHQFTPQGLSSIVWAYAIMAHPAPQLFAAVAKEAVARAADFNAQDLANLAWAFAVLDVPDRPLMLAIRDQLLSDRWSSNDLTTHALSQFHQWELWREHELHIPQSQLLPPILQAKFHQTMASAPQTTSSFEMRVHEAMTCLQEAPTSGILIDQGYSIDLALPNERIAIEVDGPSHFVSSGEGAGRAPLGRTVIKRRQLSRLGWRVLSITHFDVGTSVADIRESLQERLRSMRAEPGGV